MNAPTWLSTIRLKIGSAVCKLLPHKTVLVICKCAEGAPLSWFEMIIRCLLRSKYQAVLGEEFDISLYKELAEASSESASAWQRQRGYLVENGILLPGMEDRSETTDKLENSGPLED